MPSHFSVLAMRAVEISFFVGLTGCAIVVLMSWVSVVKGCFIDDK